MMEKIRLFVEDLFLSVGTEEGYVYAASLAALVLIVILSALLSYAVCYHVFRPIIVKIANKTTMQWDDIFFNEKTLKSMCRIVAAVVVWIMLPDAFVRFPGIHEILNRGAMIYITIMSMMLFLELISSMKSLEDPQRPTVHQYFSTVYGVLKIMVIVITVIVVVCIAIDYSPTALIAGLGATSAVLMLVFKDTIEGVAAGVRLTSNDMIQKGDWIAVPKSDINGIVEDISLTTVKVRNFDKTILTIPPRTLVNDSFQNWRGMKMSEGRRVKRVVYIDFRSVRTIDAAMRNSLLGKKYFKKDEIAVGDVNVTLYRRYIEKFLSGHKEVNPEMHCIVRQLEATTTGLPVEMYFFLSNKEWEIYEHNLADIMDRVYAYAPDFGLTIYQQLSQINQIK